MNAADFDALRVEMVDRHVAGRGVRSARVQAAMRSVPRDETYPFGL